MRFILLAVLVVPAVAWPCSGPTCDSMVVPVPSGGVIPHNAAAVGFQDSQFSESMWDGGLALKVGWVTGVALTTSNDAGTVAVTVVLVAADDGTFVVPSNGFVVGETYGLRALGPPGPPGCSGVDASFTVGPAAPWPTSSATISVSSLDLQDVEGGFCGGPIGRVQYAMLTITPSAEMVPWLTLARWELEVDGQNWSTSGYGRVRDETTTFGPWDPMHGIGNFHAQCAPGGGGPDGGRGADGGLVGGDARLGPGVHSARLLARVVGVAAPIPSNSISVNFDCATDTYDAGVGPGPDPTDGGCVEDGGGFCPDDSGVPWDGGGFVDAGFGWDGGPPEPLDGGFQDAGASDAGASDAGAIADAGTGADAGVDPGPESEGCGGCAQAPAGVLFAVVAILLRRRRRGGSQ